MTTKEATTQLEEALGAHGLFDSAGTGLHALSNWSGGRAAKLADDANAAHFAGILSAISAGAWIAGMVASRPRGYIDAHAVVAVAMGIDSGTPLCTDDEGLPFTIDAALVT